MQFAHRKHEEHRGQGGGRDAGGSGRVEKLDGGYMFSEHRPQKEKNGVRRAEIQKRMACWKKGPQGGDQLRIPSWSKLLS